VATFNVSLKLPAQFRLGSIRQTWRIYETLSLLQTWNIYDRV